MFSRNLTIIREFCLITAVAIGILQSSNYCVVAAPAKSNAQVNYKPTKEDLAHGKTQTERMLHELPAMRLWLTKDNPFYDFAVQHYAADAKGRRIYWVPFVEDGWKTDGCTALSVVATSTRQGSISIRKTSDETQMLLSSEVLWASFVFEAFNTFDGFKYAQAISMAKAKTISRDRFVLLSVEHEYDNARRTQEFYQRSIVPWAIHQKINTNGPEWYSNLPKTFEGYQRLSTDKSTYPWKFFYRYYDKYLSKKNRVDLR